MKRISSILFLVVFSLIQSNAFSDENKNFFPMGEKELFSGNTGVGGIESAAATYFNPGALTQIKSSKFSVSATAFYKYTFEGSPMMSLDGEDQDYKSSSFNSVPSSIISVYKMSDWTAAFTIMVPFNEELENQQVWTSAINTVYYQQKQEDSDLWLGLSLAKELGAGWSLGSSLFAVKGSALSMSSYYRTNNSGSSVAELTSVRSKINTWSALAVIGLMKEFDSLSLGIKAQTPTIQLKGDGDYYASSISYTAATTTYQDTMLNKHGTAANRKLPADFSIGVNYHLNDKLNLLADFSLQLGIKFKEFEDPEIIANLHEENELEFKPMYRVNFGVEYMPSDKFDILAGAYYIPSATKQGSEKFDAIGVTTGGYYATNKTKSGLGLFAVQMTGEGEVEGSSTVGKRKFTAYGAVLSTSYSF